MKKLLLSLAVAVMGAFATSAATYEIYAGGEETWTATEDGFTTTVTVDGKSFTLTTAKASSTSTLKDPGTTNAIRVFKGSDLTISSTDFEFNNVFLTKYFCVFGNKQLLFDKNPDMKILIKKESFYVSSKRANSTDYFRKQLKQRHRRLFPAQGQFQRHPPGTDGSRNGCHPGIREKSEGGSPVRQ